MTAIGFTPACRRQHRRTGRQRDNGEALERPRTMPEKLNLDSIGRTRVLVERKDDHIAGREPLENGVERPTLGHDAEARAPKSSRDQCVQPLRLDGAANKVNAAMHLRKAGEARDRRHLEAAEVPRQNQHTLASIERACKRLDALHLHPRGAARGRHPSKAQELAEQSPQMAVMRLRQALDLDRRHCSTEHAP